MPEAYNRPNPSIIEEPRTRKQVRRFEYGMESESSIESDKEEVPEPGKDILKNVFCIRSLSQDMLSKSILTI